MSEEINNLPLRGSWLAGLLIASLLQIAVGILYLLTSWIFFTDFEPGTLPCISYLAFDLAEFLYFRIIEVRSCSLDKVPQARPGSVLLHRMTMFT
jgi:hypothetical protein